MIPLNIELGIFCLRNNFGENVQLKISDVDIETLLRKAGLRATRPRHEVLKIILENPNTPMSIDELVELLPKGFDRVTAYRIVNSFAEKGLLEKINHLSNTLKVILSPRLREKHQHLVTCRLCGSTYTANICVQPGWREKLTRLGFTNVSHNLSFTGVCADH